MNKLLGVICIFLGCAGLGLWYKEQVSGRLWHMRQLQRLLSLMMSEITFGRATLPECCDKLAASLPEPYSSSLKRIYQETLQNTGVEFRELFIKHMKSCLEGLPLEAEDREAFLWFAGHGGLQDRDMQIKLLQESYERVHDSILEQERREHSRGQLAVSLGVMGGLLLIVVFI